MYRLLLFSFMAVSLATEATVWEKENIFSVELDSVAVTDRTDLVEPGRAFQNLEGGDWEAGDSIKPPPQHSEGFRPAVLVSPPAFREIPRLGNQQSATPETSLEITPNKLVAGNDLDLVGEGELLRLVEVEDEWFSQFTTGLYNYEGQRIDGLKRGARGWSRRASELTVRLAEPGTVALMIVGLIGLLMARRKIRR